MYIVISKIINAQRYNYFFYLKNKMLCNGSCREKGLFIHVQCNLNPLIKDAHWPRDKAVFYTEIIIITQTMTCVKIMTLKRSPRRKINNFINP